MKVVTSGDGYHQLAVLKNANFLVVYSCSFGEDSEDSGSVVST